LGIAQICGILRPGFGESKVKRRATGRGENQQQGLVKKMPGGATQLIHYTSLAFLLPS
jgi:hypothetical protein